MVKCQSVPVIAAESPVTASHADKSVEEEFKRRVLERYSSVEEAWKAFDSVSVTNGKLTRSDFKTIVASLLEMKITKSQQGKLRRQLDENNTKVISKEDFNAFFGHVPNTSVASSAQTQQAVLPMDCPQISDAYRSRPTTEKSLVALLIGESKSKSPRIVAVGMVSTRVTAFCDYLLTYVCLLV